MNVEIDLKGIFGKVAMCLLGILSIGVILFINYHFFLFMFMQTTAFAIALFLLWLLLGSWTSAIGLTFGFLMIVSII